MDNLFYEEENLTKISHVCIHVNNIQELLVTYDKNIGIMSDNINGYTRLYMYNYKFYCETLKSREKIGYITEKWNYDAAE